jgi:Ca-activated chloride channel family protein
MTIWRGAVFVAVCLSFWITCVRVARAQTHVETHIVSDSELVRVPVIVFDDKGAVATNLKKTDFRLFEDGVEQPIRSLDRERVPVSFVIVADLSSSMTGKIPFVQDAALSLIDNPPQKTRARDEYSILGVGKRSRLLVPFTSDQADLEKRLPLLLTDTGESTALFDGMWLGVSTADSDSMNEHRAMIVITDGGDNHSRYNLRETKKLLEESDVPVFAVVAGPLFEFPHFFSLPQSKPDGFPNPHGTNRGAPNLNSGTSDQIGPAERRGPHNMKVLAEASGGGVFTARREEDLPRIVQTIGLALRYRYILTYTPLHDHAQGVAGSSTLHKIFLELEPKDKFAKYSAPYYKRTYRSPVNP